ncbi:DNA-binding two component response transcriptional regulator (OmpR family) [Magnetospirillum gryphiswaldense MSR-1 v2]|uniref:Regulatory protein VirG n=2 Tax=Magnetospirillum gryphiswaldense TaxID=55518 RepID=V6EZV3_MAGGM|nr:DNA-binding two component response transcriptional regulator (OmpR family) [Magnetospirillum gryphiswaldense MSR-1 v2]
MARAILGAMNTTPHILVVDDDHEIRDLLARFLAKHGLHVSTARDGAEMTKLLDAHGIDLVVLDLMMPGEDGLSLTRRLRAQGCTLPIIMLTAMAEDTDRIVGLEVGADDYLPKPFNPRELLARIKAVLRRAPAESDTAAPTSGGGGHRLRFDGWVLDMATRDLTDPDGVVLTLSAGEFDLLRAFVEHPRRVLSRDQLLDLARGRQAIPFDRSIDIQVSRLRRKLNDDPKEPQLIKTVRGGGYLFTPDVVRS